MPDQERPEVTESDADAAWEGWARVAARALRVPLAVITLFDEAQGCRVWSVGCDVAEVDLGADLSFTWRLLLPATGSRPPISLTLTAPSRQPGASRHHLSTPLRVRGEDPMGVLCIGDGDRSAAMPGGEWTQEEHAVLQDVAAMAAGEIELRRERASRQACEARLERMEQLKSQFASALRHEFGQPLTVIQGFSELISDEGLTPEEIREYAAEINREAAHLAEVLARIRDMDETVAEFAASRRAR